MGVTVEAGFYSRLSLEDGEEMGWSFIFSFKF